MTEFYVSYPLHELYSGPIDYVEKEVEVSTLDGVYLDYGLALAVGDFQTCYMDFLPGGNPWRIRVGSDHSSLSPWSPTKDIELAQKIIFSQLGNTATAETGNLLEPLRSIVATKLGERIHIPLRKNA